ncbi:hypothetical protein [Streptomyces sp. ME19-01-6]|uniref:hypothetical protein n=1 Tax=Streptomyces sp. ME19-01-6 TaxID=3028686 RepID=UPI0029A1BA28|nr:hypothetical protein [Streptomyces sp. ME19-01-6]MDX3232966.1 hypothetical protein [Streptomyces sp. ME19-01-6]
MPEPRYDARTVTAPDGTHITVVYEPGSPVEHMTDAEFIAEFNPDKMRRTVADACPHDVTDLAEERLRRHPCGTPYTGDEIAPLLGGPDSQGVKGSAERIAELINLVVDARLHGGGRHA